jgi:hypothetical protein
MKLENILVFLGTLAVLALAAFFFWIIWDTGNQNNEKAIRLQQDCVQSGNMYILGTGCLPVAVINGS